MLWRMMEASILLMLTGVLTALITIFVNLSVYYLDPVRFLIVSALDQAQGHVVAALVFTLYLVAMSLISVVKKSVPSEPASNLQKSNGASQFSSKMCD